MKKIACIVQEHMFSTADIQKMEAGFREIYRDHYSSETLKVLWMIMPQGYAYSERKPSNATVILVEVNDDITKSKREDLMHKFSQLLLNTFNVSPLDSVVTVANSSYVDAFFQAQRKRITPLYRPWISFKMLFAALKSKWTKGYLQLKVRY